MLLYYAGLHFACFESHFHPSFYYWFIIFSWVLIFLENLFFLWCFYLMWISQDQIMGFWIWLKPKQVLPSLSSFFFFAAHYHLFIFHNGPRNVKLWKKKKVLDCFPWWSSEPCLPIKLCLAAFMQRSSDMCFTQSKQCIAHPTYCIPVCTKSNVEDTQMGVLDEIIVKQQGTVQQRDKKQC